MSTDHHHDRGQTVVIDVRGLRFGTEKNVVEAALGRRPGVTAVEANPVAQTANVTFDPAVASLADIRGWVQECGYHCAGMSVPQHVCEPMPMASDMRGHEGHVLPQEHEGLMPEEGGGHAGHAHGDGMSMAAMATDMRNRFIVGLIFAVTITMYSHIGMDILGLHLPVPFGLRGDVWQLLLSLPVIFWSSSMFFRGAVDALRARTLDMMVLVAVGIGTGWAYSVGVTLTGGVGDVFYEAATMLAAFVLLGHWFEMRARGGANDAIRSLLDLAPAVAMVERDGTAVEVPTGEVVVGDLLLIRPGSKIPVDGVVEEGESEVDESFVTGESLPVHKGPGSDVIGATINRNGVLHARATSVGSDTALAQIVKLVQQAQNSKAPGQRLADRAAFWLVLVALLGGLLTFGVWMIFSSQSTTTALLYAITVVVITCPDALGLATPTAIMVGSGLGARRGVLFKHATAIETSARIDVVVMDKTGTLTNGRPEVTDQVFVAPEQELQVLHYAAAVEELSEHPIAEAFVSYVKTRVVDGITAKASGFINVPGQGAVADVDGHRVAVGSKALMDGENIPLGQLLATWKSLADVGRTVMCVAIDGEIAAVLGVADAPRPTSVEAVQTLREMGIRVVMLTGDNPVTAQRIAQELQLTEVIADVRPGDKAAEVSKLQATGASVAMVGDGVNDAPALAQADLGIAIGAGTDVAIETADVVLMRSDPLDVAIAVKIGRGTVHKMRQNLGWAIGYNTIALPIAAGVFVPWFGFGLRPEIAALTMSGSSIIVAVNAVLLKRLRLPSQPGPAASVDA